MSRAIRPSLLVVSAVGLSVLLASPALAVPKNLEVTSVTCGGVTVSAMGMPKNQQLFLLVTDLATGKALGGGPSPVRSDANGEVHARRSLSLSGVRTVDVSLWTKKGETLTMTAQERSSTNCGGGAALPRTGSSPIPLLAAGLALLLAGALAVWRARGTSRRASPA
jgi:LPXTG-motif cell wall-anchored protein